MTQFCEPLDFGQLIQRLSAYRQTWSTHPHLERHWPYHSSQAESFSVQLVGWELPNDLSFPHWLCLYIDLGYLRNLKNHFEIAFGQQIDHLCAQMKFEFVRSALSICLWNTQRWIVLSFLWSTRWAGDLLRYSICSQLFKKRSLKL